MLIKRVFFLCMVVMVQASYLFSSNMESASVTTERVYNKVFGDVQSDKQNKFIGTRYWGNQLQLQRDLKDVRVDTSIRFAQDWSAQRAQKIALLKEAFGNKLTLSDIECLVGEISYKAYMKRRCDTESLIRCSIGQQLINDLIKNDLLECVFGKEKSEKRKKLQGTRFEGKLYLLVSELEQVEVDLSIDGETDWQQQKTEKIMFLYTEFGPNMNGLDIVHLLKIAEEAYNVLRKRAED